jgi:hypothetical protein
MKLKTPAGRYIHYNVGIPTKGKVFGDSLRRRIYVNLSTPRKNLAIILLVKYPPLLYQSPDISLRPPALPLLSVASNQLSPAPTILRMILASSSMAPATSLASGEFPSFKSHLVESAGNAALGELSCVVPGTRDPSPASTGDRGVDARVETSPLAPYVPSVDSGAGRRPA